MLLSHHQKATTSDGIIIIIHTYLLFHELLILLSIYPCVHSHTCTLDQEKGHLENRPGHKYLSTQLPEIDRPAIST